MQDTNQGHNLVEKSLGNSIPKCVGQNVKCQNDYVVNNWGRLVKAFRLEKYFRGNLGLQDVRALHVKQAERIEKQDLPWRILEQIMLLNSQCREIDISSFAENLQPKIKSKKKTFGQTKTTKENQETRADGIPHPMDMILLLITCSDYMLRQTLARKLFMCRLAIPFIVPTPEDTVEMLLWPLRSIVMEWRNEKQEAMEESLVMGKMNMVTFIRYGSSKFSKSKLVNKVLSSNGHPTFFHKGSPCGNEKRQISNGTVEMSHFLPAGNQHDQFTHPALFFNLRGDACDHPVQHELLLDLAAVIVIIIDINELHCSCVQVYLQEAVRKKQGGVVVVLTDSKEHDEDTIEELSDMFSDLVGEAIDVIKCVTTFEIEGGIKNMTSLIKDIRRALQELMSKRPELSLGSYAYVQSKCTVDEKASGPCRKGREIAEELQSEMLKLDTISRKRILLPQQGPSLLELGKLIRQLHRGSTKGESLSDKENIKQKINAIKQEQSDSSRSNTFLMNVLSLFYHAKDTKTFAIRWLQLEMDALSRSCLPQLQHTRNHLWNELKEARDKEKSETVSRSEENIRAAESNIAAAVFGWEHLIREIGQLYEVSADLKKMHWQGSMQGLSSLPDIISRQLVEGFPVELMDGDHGIIPVAWVKAVFQSLAQIVGQEKKIFVLSVIGIQSSGKSTLLNTMFGLEFAVSAGRCTRGIYAQLLPVADRLGLPFDFMLVLDSEGLRAQELGQQNYEHDNELATLVIGLADLVLVNMKGENVMEMTDVLQIVVHAFLRMKLADSPHKRQCKFIHQNVAAVNAQEKLALDRQKLQEQLDNMTKQASVAQGLSETITSFNRIISFDCQRDVVYFSDLWNGDPPMATVNHGYSSRVAETQQIILQEISQSFSGCIAVPEFITRVQDMWNGVLADDFIFSFRSSLAAKAYIEVEREVARLTVVVEQDMWNWVNTHCKLEMDHCQTEDDLHHCWTKVKDSLHIQITKEVEQNIKVLEEFFEKHAASEIINQWKSEKMSSFQLCGQALKRQTESDLEDVKVRKLFELHQKNASQTHEQEIIKKAVTVAESVRGKCPTDWELQETFGEVWNSLATISISAKSQDPTDVLSSLYQVLWDKMITEGNSKYLLDQLEATPFNVVDKMNPITSCDIIKDHIMLKDKSLWHRILGRACSRADCIPDAVDVANNMLKTVMDEAENICKQDTMFKPLHGRQIIDVLWEEIATHNNLPLTQAAFAFSTQFNAMMAVRVASCAVFKFQQMNEHFEEKHGVQAQMNSYKRRVFLLFKNTTKEASAEVTASEDFCETLKAQLIEYVRLEVEQSVLKEMYQAVGSTKYDLIIKMLDEIAQTENFSALYHYVYQPINYARSWMQQFGIMHIFTAENGSNRYCEYVDQAVRKIFMSVLSSTTAATNVMSSMQGSGQYSMWITEFCVHMSNSISLDPTQLQMASVCNIKNFKQYQKFLESNLQNLEEDVKAKFLNTTVETVMWLDGTSPFDKVCKRLWGCTEHCPFCNEPCQDSDPYHQSSHRCVQHRPSGVRGITERQTQLLAMETCSLDVSSKRSFRCDVIDRVCGNTKYCHCNEWDSVEHLVYHPYQDYKKYLPRWDIAPDPAGSASKYWQWIVYRFQTELLEVYKGAKLDIPYSWRFVTKQQAIDSLRIFY